MNEHEALANTTVQCFLSILPHCMSLDYYPFSAMLAQAICLCYSFEEDFLGSRLKTEG
jgi:hypothetical protein